MSDRFLSVCAIIGVVWTILLILGGRDTEAIVNAILRAGLGPLIVAVLGFVWAWCALCAIAVAGVLAQRLIRRL
jgi:hypothetical protein